MINKDRALEPIEFIQCLKHTGDFYGQPFTLLDWQHEVYGMFTVQLKIMGIESINMLTWKYRKKTARPN